MVKQPLSHDLRPRDEKRFRRAARHPQRNGSSTSLESVNNFINFCATINLPLTDGKQIRDGSCNPAPMGSIPSIDHVPSVKFQSPINGDTVKADSPLIVSIAVNNLNTGSFVNAQSNYLGAPQQLSDSMILGHGGIVVERMNSLDQTAPLNPLNFAFFKGIPEPASNGIWTVNITNGISEGFYRMSSMTQTANHHSIVVPVLQHGAIDDVVYFTVTSDGQPTDRTSLGSFISPAPGGSASINTTDPSTNPAIQNSTTLSTSVIASGFASNGQDPPATNQVASLTSVNNFINYCLLEIDTTPITNGKQIGRGSCSPTPIGVIPPISVMPSHKFQSPKHGDTIPAKTPFLVKLNYRNMNQDMADPDNRYLSAPQQIGATGAIFGYSRIVIEALTAINQTSVTDPRKIAVSTALTEVDENGAMMTNITNGLPDGFYRLSSIALTANHYPVVLPVTQHGAVNDAIYFTVGNGGNGSTSANTVPAGPQETGTGNPGSGARSSNSVNVGAAVGGALGGLALIVLIIALVFFYRQRRKRIATEAMFIPQMTYPVQANYPIHAQQYMPPPLPPQPGEIQPYYIGPSEGTMLTPSAARASLSEKQLEKHTHLVSTFPPSSYTSGSSSSQLRTPDDTAPPTTLHRTNTVTSVAPSYHTVANPQR
ncbi:hypothetical protein VNI00_005314 [Paramarasmius palmivorus]|uniref:Uncharacterized protein n=1 Tax=Paramarasmius palmivorus TaxID=297713 RepID=A0AAW0DDQ0_9AGAR